MILVDSSIWVDHLRTGHARLASFLESQTVLGHPWVVGEIALGNLSQRKEILSLLTSLPSALVATHGEVMRLIDNYELYGRGIGYVDAQLLASTLLTPDATFWANDKPLMATATLLGCAMTEA